MEGIDARERAAAWARGLSLEERVAQLLMPLPSDGTPLRAHLGEIPVGGFIVDERVGASPPALADALADAQSVARDARGIPLFVSIDQEGGHVSAMRSGATETPIAMALAATGDPRAAADAAALLATELRGIGANWMLAPVADVNVAPENPVIGARAFSDDPAVVAAFASAWIRGAQAEGVLACAKHFPGHGDTRVDSHVGLPVLPHDRARLERVELPPFRAAIAAGVASVMTAHVRVPALDPERVGTVSRAVIGGLLRGELGFGGIVVSDALDMAGVASELAPGDAAVEAVRAGADVLLTGAGLARQHEIRAALVAAVRSGRIDAGRFEDALARVLVAKATLPAADRDALARVGSAAHRRRALELARRSITLLRDDAAALPLRRDLGARLVVLSPVGTRRTMMETWHAGFCALGAELARRVPGAIDIQVEYPLSEGTRAEIARWTGRADVVVVGTLNAILDPDQVAVLEALRADTSAEVVVAPLRTPYDVLRVPWARTVVCAYTTVHASMTALAEVLTGEAVASGRLPVAVPGLYRRGHRVTAPSSAPRSY